MRSDRPRRESEPIPYQFSQPNHAGHAPNLLPPPVHSQGGPPPSPITSGYDRPFEHRNEYVPAWPSRDPPMYGERRDHEYVENRRPEFQRSRDTGIYGHHPYGAS